MREQLQDFLDKNTGRPVVCITSGGTIVPLEKNMVRFLDNFSEGVRGAKLVEYYLALGYGVIFFSRAGSRSPFTSVWLEFAAKNAGLKKKSTNVDVNFMLALSTLLRADKNTLEFDPEKLLEKNLMREIVLSDKICQSNRLFMSSFVSIDDYLESLEIIAEALSPLKSRAAFVLAAAVSDFYLPKEEMPEHKIQSRKEFRDSSSETTSVTAATTTSTSATDSEGLDLHLFPVPKMLGQLTKRWAPSAYVISFKLETDEHLLLTKARKAIEKYDVNLVVANLLQTRRDEVFLVDSLSSEDKTLRIPRRETEHTIEGDLSLKLKDFHYNFSLQIHQLDLAEGQTRETALEREITEYLQDLNLIM